MKLKRWIIGIITVIALLAAVVFVIKHNKDRNYIIEKYPETALLLSFIEQSKNDTVVVSDFNDLYRRLFLSKINDSIITFCHLNYNGGFEYLLIISPDSISIFEAPDHDANYALLGIMIAHKHYVNNTKSLFRQIEQTIDVIFRQEQVKFYRFIGFIKDKPNRVLFIDNFYGFFSAGAFCHTLTIKNNMLNPKKWVFVNDRISMKNYTWRLPFPDNMVPKDSILPRIQRVNSCKDSIQRWLMYVE